MHVKQAAHVLELMEYFEQRRRPATLAEISDNLGWPRSSTFNLVGTIVDKGYLYEPRPRAGYYPTPRWLALAQSLMEVEPLPDFVHELVAAVASGTGETTAVGTLTGAHAMFLLVEESRHSVRYSVQVGERVPVHASSAGRAILAQYPAAARQAIYRRISFEPFSATTPMSAETVEAELVAAARRGYHQSAAEYIPDLAGVAMPLPIGARSLSIVVAGPTSRCLERRPDNAFILRNAIAKHVPEDSRTTGPRDSATHRS